MPITHGLSPAVVSIRVYKSAGRLELYGDGKPIGAIDCITGQATGHKQREGDLRTPEGEYRIVTRNDNSNYTLFFGINYPKTSDAKFALATGEISEGEYAAIVQSERDGVAPPWDTALGGWIGIHGGSEGRKSTIGCIAVSDEDITAMGQYLKIGDSVCIYE